VQSPSCKAHLLNLCTARIAPPARSVHCLNCPTCSIYLCTAWIAPPARSVHCLNCPTCSICALLELPHLLDLCTAWIAPPAWSVHCLNCPTCSICALLVLPHLLDLLPELCCSSLLLTELFRGEPANGCGQVRDFLLNTLLLKNLWRICICQTLLNTHTHTHTQSPTHTHTTHNAHSQTYPHKEH